MAHDPIVALRAQVQPVLAHRLLRHVILFLQPIAAHLATHVDIRLVQTALVLVQVILGPCAAERQGKSSQIAGPAQQQTT
jgi:hypothetical protein